jgi:hypothetical protein
MLLQAYKKTISFLFFFFFLAILGFELKISCLLRQELYDYSHICYPSNSFASVSIQKESHIFALGSPQILVLLILLSLASSPAGMTGTHHHDPFIDWDKISLTSVWVGLEPWFSWSQPPNLLGLEARAHHPQSNNFLFKQGNLQRLCQFFLGPWNKILKWVTSPLQTPLLEWTTNADQCWSTFCKVGLRKSWMLLLQLCKLVQHSTHHINAVLGRRSALYLVHSAEVFFLPFFSWSHFLQMDLNLCHHTWFIGGIPGMGYL